MGLWRHNKKYHDELNIFTDEKINVCKYCNKELSCKQSKWRHEKKCQNSNSISLEEQVKKLSQQ